MLVEGKPALVDQPVVPPSAPDVNWGHARSMQKQMVLGPGFDSPRIHNGPVRSKVSTSSASVRKGCGDTGRLGWLLVPMASGGGDRFGARGSIPRETRFESGSGRQRGTGAFALRALTRRMATIHTGSGGLPV